MINMIEGRPGAGKTLFLVTRLLAIRRRNPKRRIFTNFSFGEFDEDGKLVVPYSEPIRTWDDFSRLHDGIVAIDESSLWCPSEANKSLPRQQRVMLKQHRKGGLEVWLTDQSYEHTAKVVRDMVARVYTLHRFGPFIIGTGRDPISLQPYGRIYSMLNAETFKYYRTDEYIGDGYTGEGYGFSEAEKWTRKKEEELLVTVKLTTGRQLYRLVYPWDPPIPEEIKYIDDGNPHFPYLRRAGWVERV